ncbi:MAG: trypsin-like peptidase domain-containing protein [Acidimicrobiia bacterium]|jgi:putative serine protease PepD
MPADDDEASGPPPHPLDRVWFHPSELGAAAGSVGALRPQPAPARQWLVAALALLVGISGTLGIVTAVGGFSDGATTTSPARIVNTPLVDPDAVATLVTSVGRSIVTISVTPAEGGDPAFTGSGVVVRAGRVLTAAHLLGSSGTPSVITVGGQVGTVSVLGVDPETDLALLKVEGADLVPARLATGDGLRIGQSVAALAAGPAPDRWVTAGVISGMNRMGTLAGGIQGVALIETDARFDDTAAGGALLDASGAVIGILTGPESHAVPIDVARDVVAQLDLNGRAAHGWTGILGVDALDRPGGGVRIRALVPGSPAEAAGLQVDDVVLAVGDIDVGNVGELVASLRRRKPGDPVEVTVIRATKRVKVPVALGASVAAPADWLVVA